MHSSATAIDVRALSKTYREGILIRKLHNALNDVTLSVSRGEVFGLLGPNGAGKTTLIKILLGILHPDKGAVRVLDMKAGSKDARRRIGYLPENLLFPRHHTGRSALYFYGRLNEMTDAQIAAKEKELFELVSLTGRQHEPVRRYSKGMRQRLGLAQAMLHDPDLLIFDEPTDGLDPMGRSQVRDVLYQLKERGKTVFLNSHILQEVELICDRVAIMALGRLRGIGTIDQLIESHPEASKATVTLEVAGDINAIETALSECSFLSPPSTQKADSETDVVHRIQIQAADQADVDRAIDRLRDAGISIYRMERFRPTLEQVFLSIVGSISPHAVSPTPIKSQATSIPA